MRHRYARLGFWSVLATSPDTSAATGAFGNAILNVLWSFYMARATTAVLAIEPTDPARYAALWRMGCAGLRTVAHDARGRRRVAHCLRVAARVPATLRGPLRCAAVDGPGDPPAGDQAPWLHRPSFGLNIRRLLVDQPLDVHLDPEHDSAAKSAAAALGLLDAPHVVTLHVREQGYKDRQGTSDRDIDTVRNARIDSYLQAIDWLVAHGFLVVRIGDPSMTPLRRHGVVDVATDARSTLALQLFCVKRSTFFVATDSGPYNLALLCDVPCLATNVTHVIGSYPLRPADRYLPRPVSHTATGMPLTIGEMMTPHHLKFRWDPAQYVFGSNSAEEILDGVREMCGAVAGEWQESGAQREFRDVLLAFLDTDYGRKKQKRDRSGVTEPYFLGQGWCVNTSASRLVNQVASA